MGTLDSAIRPDKIILIVFILSGIVQLGYCKVSTGFSHPCSFSPLGCVLPFEEVTSRTFASLQSSCHHSCDMHKVLQEAMERFRARHCALLLRRGYQDDSVEQTDPDSAAEPQSGWKNWSGKRPFESANFNNLSKGGVPVLKKKSSRVAHGQSVLLTLHNLLYVRRTVHKVVQH